MPIKTFRGQLNDGEEKKLFLARNDGRVGYRIKEFRIIPNKPVTSANECVMQIWKTKPAAVSNEIDFSDQRLMGIGVYSNQTDTTYYPDDMIIIFDDIVVNQDIYITHNNASGSEPCNYQLHLEEIQLSRSEATLSTLRDIRNIGV